MQLFIAPLAAAYELDLPDLANRFGQYAGLAVMILAAMFLAAVLPAWIASKVVAPNETGTFPNAAKYVIYTMLISVGTLIGLLPILLLLFFVALLLNMPPDSWAVMITIISIVGLAFLTVGLLVPMRVYRLDFLRVIVFLLIFGVMIAALGVLTTRTITFKGGEKLNVVAMFSEEKMRGYFREVGARLSGKSGSESQDTPAAIAADRSRPLPERQAALQQMEKDLNARRDMIQPSNQAAVDAYNKDLAEYIELINKVQSDTPATPAH